MADSIFIAQREIGPGQPCFFIAEAGVNHNGDPDLARQLVDAAAAAGADAVKFQTFSADRLAAKSAPKAQYQIQTTGAEDSQYTMLRALELSESAHRDLQEYCRRREIIFLSTPFDEQSADFLASLNVPAFKLSSGDLTNHPLISHVCGMGRPVILSTGMATLDEVEAAVGVAKQHGNGVALLQCVSNYPAVPQAVNLRVMQTFARLFEVPTGYSDHTLGIAVPIAAAALGATIIEKHFTLDRKLPGPDHRASLEPAELQELLESIRTVESALGDGRKQPWPDELPVRDVGRKSLHWQRDVGEGAIACVADFIALRPGTGISPAARGELVGKALAHAVRAGQPVRHEDFSG
jgi:N-acetylneuraminate synthase/N,N'-diacetyllegionaminate synthase